MLPLTTADGQTVVQTVRPVASYVGGKRVLAPEVIARINRTPHKTYAEPFVGMGGVFLRRTMRPRAEVINDISQDVTTFFRILQRHYAAFLEMLKFQLTTRAEFERLSKTDPATLTDLERAARFLYLQNCAYGGKVSGRHFGVDPGSPGAFNVLKLVPMLDDVHERLAGVVIERLPWDDFIPRYDRPDVLFYLDPPYWGSEDYYGKNVFARDDFTRLADVLRALQGRFLLSINDVPEIRDLFAWATVETVDITYTVGGGGTTEPSTELIISSPPPVRVLQPEQERG